MANNALLILLMIFLLVSPSVRGDEAEKIASIDFCADQYLLALSETDRIAGVSEDAAGDRSMFRDKAHALKVVSANLEELLLLDPRVCIAFLAR